MRFLNNTALEQSNLKKKGGKSARWLRGWGLTSQIPDKEAIEQNKKEAQIVGLSATIGNPQELAEWLDAELVEDDWRPVKLHKGVYFDGKFEFG